MKEYAIYYTNFSEENEVGAKLKENPSFLHITTMRDFRSISSDSDAVISSIVLDLQPFEDRFYDIVKSLSDNLNLHVFVVLHDNEYDVHNKLLLAGATLVMYTPFDVKILTDRVEARSKHALEAYEKNKEVETYTSLAFDLKTGMYRERTFDFKAAEYLRENPDDDIVVVTCEIEELHKLTSSLGKTFTDAAMKFLADGIKKFCDEHELPCGILEDESFVLMNKEKDFSLSDLAFKIHSHYFSNIDRELNIFHGIYKIVDKKMPIREMIDRSLIACSHATGKTTKPIIFDEQMKKDLELKNFVMQNYNKAFDNGEFKVYYQPVVALNSNKVVSCEALARWVHPERGVIPPDKFIPLFEEHGIIPRLDMRIWEEACTDMRERIDTGTKHIVPISINMSRIDFYNDNLVEDLDAILAKYSLDHKYIRVEITESALQDNDEKLYKMAERLREHGYVILMDDFGTGYSSFESLSYVPIDILKLDMSFIRNLKTNAKISSIVASIVRMCKFLDMKVIAEGVETPEQRDFLRSIGCEYGQGYLYSKPLPVDEFHAAIEGKRLTETEQVAIEKRDMDLKAIWDVETNFSNLFNNMISPIGFYEYDDNFGLTIVRANSAYFTLLGGKKPHLYSNPNDVFRSEYRRNKEAYDKLLQKAKKTGKICSAAMTRYKYDGKKFPCIVSLKYLGSIANKEEYVFSLRDVTEETTLRQQVDMLQAALAAERGEQ